MAKGDATATSPRPGGPTVAALAFAAGWPTALAWLYFVALAGGAAANPLQQTLYAAGKGVQLLFPVAAARLLDGRWPRPTTPTRRGLVAGVALGLFVSLGLFALYFGVLRRSHLLNGR